jgi:Carboxypeptidase regulatory-like domain
MKHLLTLFPALIICFAVHCTHVSGTASEVEGRYAVAGQVVEKSGSPVKGAIVRIRPIGFLALNGMQTVAFDTITDRNGFFYFDTIPVDSYTIEINLDGKLGALRPLTICTYDSFPVVLPVTTVSPTGSIIGRINLPISDDTSRPWVALYNVDYLVKAPITQEFSFEGIPEGVYHLRIVPYLKSKLVLELQDIQVIGNK